MTLNDVRAAVLALCFGELSALSTDSLFANSNESRLDELSGSELQDMVTRRVSDIAHPSLPNTLASIVKECSGDPLILLWQATRHVAQSSSSSGAGHFPLHLFADTHMAGRHLDFDIADPHLHSGGSLPLSLFFSGLASSVKPIERSRGSTKLIRTSDGRQWELLTLLEGLRWAYRLLRFLGDGNRVDDVARLEEYRLTDAVVERVRAGAYWKVVETMACGGQRNLRVSEAWSREFRFGGLCQITEPFWKLAQDPTYGFSAKRSFLMGLIRASVAVADFVSARPGDGLSRFVDRFDDMGFARDAALGELKAQLTVSVLNRIAATPDVVGAEFRKTVVAKGSRQFTAELKAALRSHHGGFLEFTRDTGRALALSMPVGFLRRPCRGAGEWSDFAQLQDAMAGYHALRRLLRSARISSAVYAFDVAGDETGSASWPYAVIAELFRRERVDLVYTIHAGETFYSQFNGVRRVGELFLASRTPDRIGHALSLSGTAATAICGEETIGSVRIGDLIQDAAWAQLAGVDELRAHQLLQELTQLGSGSVPIEAWVSAYRTLFDVDALVRRGVLSSIGGRIDPAGARTAQALRRGDEVDRALAALVWGGDARYVGCDVTDPASPRAREISTELSIAAAPAARKLVLGWLAKAGTIIEACPTSNVRLARLEGTGSHPLWEWKSTEGIEVEVAVGSDDPLIFGSSIGDEFRDLLACGDESIVRELASSSVRCCSGGHPRWGFADFAAVLQELR